MKIVYCINGTFNSGGMERVLANKANYLSSMGYDITVVTTDQQGRVPYFEFDNKIKHVDLGINYTLVNGLFNKLTTYISNQKKHQRKLTELLLQLKANVVVSMFDHDASFLHKIGDGSKKVVEIHFSRFKRLQYGRKGLWRIIDEWRSKKDLDLVQHYAAFVVLTHEDKGYWGDLKNIHVIPNANSFEVTDSAALLSKNAIAVGRLSDQKDYDSMVDIWRLVSSAHPDWILNIYGHGELEDVIMAKIEDYGLTQQIRIHKPVSNIKDKYLESSMHIMTSKYEGLPMAMLEAQVCGLPLLSYDCKCGPKDVIEDGKNGYIISSGDKEGFAERIKELIVDTNKRKLMGEFSKYNSANYSEERVMQQWIQLFNSL